MLKSFLLSVGSKISLVKYSKSASLVMLMVDPRVSFESEKKERERESKMNVRCE